MKAKIFFILLLLTLGLSKHMAQEMAYGSTPFIQNYSAEAYDGGIQNWDITQSQDGRLYVANNLGLLEFDGSNWENYQLRYGTKLRSLLIIEDKIYVGSQNDFGFFQPDEKGGLLYTSLADSLPARLRNFDETWKIYEEQEKVYFCTFNQIFILENDALKAIDSDFPLEISFFIEHELMVQEWGKGLSILKGDRLELIRDGALFKDKRISSIIPFARNKQLITTFNDGIYFLVNNSIEKAQFNSIPDDLIINSAIMLQNGDLAVGTQTNGLFILSPEGNLKTKLSKSVGLLDNTINAIYEDANGSLWLSLNNGISRVDLSSPLSIIDERAGIQGAGYAALQIGGKTYLGTNIGAFIIENGRSQFIAGSEGQVYNIQEFNGQVYLGHHEGLMKVDNDKAQLISNEKGAWKLIDLPAVEGLAILGTYNGLRLFDLKSGTFISSIEGFNESSRVMAIEDDQLWVTQGYKGAYKISLSPDNSKVENVELYNSANGFPSDFLINVFEVDGQLVFTAEQGFYQFDESRNEFISNESLNELIGSNASIVDMDEDPMGNIYFIERDQIGRLSPTVTGSYELMTSSFGMARPMWNDDLGNITVLNTNEVLIGAREGFILYDRRKDKGQAQALKVSFDEISLLNESAEVLFNGHGSIAAKNISLPYKNNSLSFRFYSPDFQSGQKTVYQYRLLNYQEEWSNWTSTAYKEFTNLKEGNYAFQVRAKNIFDQESALNTFEFEIKPPIYRSTAAYLLYGGGTIFLLFLSFKAIDFRYQKATKDLEKKKERELKAKNKEIQEIAAESEKTIDSLRNEKLKAEIQLKSQDLTSSAMHLIQKNELLTQVKQTLKGLDKANLDNEANSKLRSLVRQIDRDLASGEEWNQFESNFDQVHGNFITRLKEAYPKLTPQEIKFSAYIRMNLNTKEIANLLNISVRGVEIGRYRVRKKLALERKDNLSDFLMRF